MLVTTNHHRVPFGLMDATLQPRGDHPGREPLGTGLDVGIKAGVR